MKLSRILIFAFVLLPIIVPDIAHADVVVYKDGKIIECIVKEKRKTGYLVWLYTESGIESEYEIPLADVKEIIEKEYWGLEYQKLLKSTDFKDEKSVRALVAWCKTNNLDGLAYKYEKRAVELHNLEIIRKYPEVTCEKCEGAGRLVCKACAGKGSTTEKCAKCKGTGRIKCETCKGVGRIPCKKCKGTGKITVKKSSSGGGGEKTVTVSCPSCRGKGKTRCMKCTSRGYLKCPKCRGTKTIKTKCKECMGKPRSQCPECQGTGINPKKYAALLKRLEKEKQKPPVVVTPTEPVKTEDDTAEKKLLARTRYINNYRKTADGEVTDEFLGAEIFLYPSLPVPAGKWPLLADNEKIYILENDQKPQDGGNGQIYYHVELDSTGHKGYVAEKYLRKKLFEYVTCEPCEGQGVFECPACQGTKTIELNGKKYDCKVCGRKGRIKCKHCFGSGKLVK